MASEALKAATLGIVNAFKDVRYAKDTAQIHNLLVVR
jgi:hypothetical protein